jgi:PAS domain S-box-containing protein
VSVHRRNIQGQATPTIEYRARHKNGSYVWFECSSKGISGKDGVCSEVIVVNRDITLRKRAEEERAQLSDILEATSDLVAMATIDGY